MRLSLLAAAAVLAPATLAAPALLGAQRATPTSTPGPRIGIVAGLSSATISGSDVAQNDGVDKKRRNGFVAGVYAALPIAGSALSIRPELLYAQKGVRVTTTLNYPGIDQVRTGGGSMTADFATKIDYLELPVLLQLDVPTTAGLRPSLYVGPSVAYRVRCRVETTIQGTTESTGCDDAAGTGGANFRKFDVSGVVGGQLGFALGGQSVGVGVRYTNGFTNIAKDIDGKNRAFAVYGTIELPFGR